MLKSLRILWGRHVSAAYQSLYALFKHPLATIMTTMVIALAITIPALFWVFTQKIAIVAQTWQQSGQITLYIDSGQTIAAQDELLQLVRATPGVAKASLKTPEEGLKELQSQSGMQDLNLQLPNNPLPPAIEVTPVVNIDTNLKLMSLYARLKVFSGVADLKVDSQWVSRLYAFLGFAKKITFALMVLLGITVISIVGNTLRLAIKSSAEEIMVLKLIGARNNYIVRPFLYTGFWYGLGAAILAIMFVYLFLLSVSSAFSAVISAYQLQNFLFGLSLKQVLAIFAWTIILGWLGARVAIMRQIASIEP